MRVDTFIFVNRQLSIVNRFLKVAISLIIIFLILGAILFFAVPFLLQNISFPGFSSSGSGIAGIFKTIDGGDFWFSKNNIESSKSTIGSANILDLVLDPFDNNIMYAGTNGAGILKSINNGESWKRLVDDNNLLASSAVINQIAINPRDPAHIFIAAFQGGSGGIFKTEDAGRSWKQLYIVPLAKQDIKTLVIDPLNPNFLYAGTTAGGFLVSSDGGESWRALKWFFDPIKKIVINPFSSAELFLVLENRGFYKTADRGENWKDLTHTFSGYPSAIRVENIVLDPQRPNVLYMTSMSGLLKSTDGGNSWRSLKILVSPETLPVQDIAIDRNNYKMIYISAGSKIYISNDEGENWTVKSLNTGKNAKLIRIDYKNPKVIFVGIHK